MLLSRGETSVDSVPVKRREGQLSENMQQEVSSTEKAERTERKHQTKTSTVGFLYVALI